MKLNILTLCAVALSIYSLTCEAQDTSGSSGATPAPEQARGWNLGIGVAALSRPYVEENARILPLPLAFYEGQRFYLRGQEAGLHLISRDAFTLDATVSARLDGIDADDFDRIKLATRGIDRNVLEDRKDGVDAGLSARLRTKAGDITASIRSDVSGASNGHEAALNYSYRLNAGAYTLIPAVGLRYQSSQLADYYYGTHSGEVSRGVQPYLPGAYTAPELSLTLARPFGEKWSFLGSARVSRLPDEVSDSPLVDGNTNASIMLSVSRQF
ncbi:MipA/OmpV family protein [Xanthomonas euvesicatoria]|uniref:MipA/OmpV family protein n=1 Tax=Xanthomonas TaxID=338 RepID=UPI002453A3CE|nr:MipA/OmpV family protein [Xanthomonas euvesicatoria]MDH4910077.1 MipA/OmpV family protein [Xanthomonas euvesicatoria]